MPFSEIPAVRSKFRRAAVIVPPLRDFYFTRHRFSSLGAEIVATLLRREGLQVDSVNFPLINTKGTCIELPLALDYLNPYIIPEETGKLSYFTRFRRFGPPVNYCGSAIEVLKPDICFISVFAFCYADDAIELAEQIKIKMPAVPIVAGGAGVSVYPEYFLKNKSIDFALCGEAEANLIKFLLELSLEKPDFRRVPNIAWKENGCIQVSPLRAFPAPGDMEIALVKTAESARRVTFSTSLIRGCPKECDFCSSTLLFGNQIRTPPMNRIDNLLAAHLKEINGEGKQVTINFEDDNLLGDGQFFRSSLALFRKHLPGVSFIAENGIDYSLLTPDWCEWLVQNGMGKFNFSLASIAREILVEHGRFLEPARYEKAIFFLAEKGIPSVTYFICGFKEDTIESTADNLAYLFNKQTVTGISMFYAVPGLPGFTDKSIFDRSPSCQCLGSAAFPWNKSLSTETMITAFRLSRYINFYKSPRLSEKENQLLEIIENDQKLYTLIKQKSGGETIAEVPKQDNELVKSFFKRKKNTPHV
jgi:anaerobic magnesium-protoporphyrin IX monomethyl ester cyclase